MTIQAFDPHASTLLPPPNEDAPPSDHLATLAAIDRALQLANAEACARSFYSDLLASRARVAELEARLKLLCGVAFGDGT